MFLLRNKVQSVWGSFTIFKRKMIDLLDHFAEDSTKRLFVFVMLTKCCIFAIKTESWLLSKLFISSVSGEYRNSWGNCRFLSFSVIVTLVDSREGLVEPLLWSFVIAPLLSFSLNFCKGTITVIVWNQNTVAMQCLQFGKHQFSYKKCPKSNWIYCFKFWISVNLNVIKNDFCYCEKLFLSLFLFRVFFVLV